jgi:DNA processing protein
MSAPSVSKTATTTTALDPQFLGIPPASLHPPIKRLYARGNLAVLKHRRIALVGSRRASAQGIRDAHWFAQTAAASGLVVVSGLAVGIDAAAHEGALSATAGKTIAVLAHGLDDVYPSRNRQLAARVLDADGLLISEYPDATPARPFQFVHRNRIIAALSEVVCVIEAGEKSGAVITALEALELGKDVCAVPGPIHSPLYVGSHRLIRQGAALVTRPEEILVDLGVMLPGQHPAGTRTRQFDLPGLVDPRLYRLLTALDWHGQAPEAIAQRLGDAPEAVILGLLLLENQGLARRLADGDWVRFQVQR